MANDELPTALSKLSRRVTIDDVTVDVRIYSPEGQTKWMLEVINASGISTIWDKLFESDSEAFAAFQIALRDEGIETFLDHGGAETLH